MIPKTQNIRSKKYTDAAKGQSCVNCGRNDGTVVLAHYTGLRQHSYGKGARIKGHDVIGADLCHHCHEYFDRPSLHKSVDVSEQFLHCCALTLVRRIQQGVVKL